jgi:hypothetical protein
MDTVIGQFVIEVRGVEETIAMLGRFQPPDLTKRLHAGVERGLAKVLSEAVEDAPRDTGIGAQSLAMDVWEEDGEVVGMVGSPEVYMLVMEKGRRPASEIGLHPPPEHALDQWAQRHGYDERAAEAMRWAIAIKGIEPHPFLAPALEANQLFILNCIFEEIVR